MTQTEFFKDGGGYEPTPEAQTACQILDLPESYKKIELKTLFDIKNQSKNEHNIYKPKVRGILTLILIDQAELTKPIAEGNLEAAVEQFEAFNQHYQKHEDQCLNPTEIPNLKISDIQKIWERLLKDKHLCEKVIKFLEQQRDEQFNFLKESLSRPD